ncbi:MAG: phage capsid protein [Sulfolobales archaeon]
MDRELEQELKDSLGEEEFEELKGYLEANNEALSNEDIERIVKAIKDTLLKFLGKHYYYPYPYYGYPSPTTEAKGSVIVMSEETRKKHEQIAEALRNDRAIKEQWLTPVYKSEHEVVGRLREFCRIERILEGKPGDTVYLARVRDFDMGSWGTYGTATLADETSTDVIDFVNATVQECGVKFYMKKHLTEKADANVVQMINEVATQAARRAEDRKILNTIWDASATVLTLDKSTTASAFDADFIPEIISTFESNGIQIEPGDLVIAISPAQYEALAKDVMSSMPIAFARPDVIQKGRVTEFMGVTIRMVPKDSLPTSGGKKCSVVWKKGAITIAPKRDLSIETQPDVENRRTLVVASYAMASILSNPKHAMLVKTSEAA